MPFCKALRATGLRATRELLLDFVEPEPALFVAALLYHVEAYPADVVDADLVEGAFDEGAFERVAEILFVYICRGVHGRYYSHLFQVFEP